MDFHDRSSPNVIIVQNKDVLVNVSSSDNGGARWQILGIDLSRKSNQSTRVE